MKTYFLIKSDQVIDLGFHETKPKLAPSKGEVMEGVFATVPEYNPETQKLVETWDKKHGKWKQAFTVEAKTPLELWMYPEWAKRIIAPAELVFTDEGVKMHSWFNVMGFPIRRNGSNVELYCNVILPEHQVIVDQLEGVITIEDRPTE